MTLAYVGLGANIGDPPAAIERAVSEIRALPGTLLLRQASRYCTAPVGLLDQPDFMNTVVEIETSLTPEVLLQRFQMIELALGRQPTVHWGPRVIDLDLLLFGDVTLATAELTVPHAQMWRRLFVIAPLAELRPDLNDPDGVSILTRCAQLSHSQCVQREHAGIP
ncbi:MAG: 2-amino-4-hydroxy-6-hydroxymethyldihydropteridine diphosphokinase [Chloroflexota bacterium]